MKHCKVSSEACLCINPVVVTYCVLWLAGLYLSKANVPLQTQCVYENLAPVM